MRGSGKRRGSTNRPPRAAFDAAAAALPEVPAGLDGTGIVIPDGGVRYLAGAYTRR
jgi:hypothetical protein